MAAATWATELGTTSREFCGESELTLGNDEVQAWIRRTYHVNEYDWYLDSDELSTSL